MVSNIIKQIRKDGKPSSKREDSKRNKWDGPRMLEPVREHVWVGLKLLDPEGCADVPSSRFIMGSQPSQEHFALLLDSQFWNRSVPLGQEATTAALDWFKEI